MQIDMQHQFVRRLCSLCIECENLMAVGCCGRDVVGVAVVILWVLRS